MNRFAAFVPIKSFASEYAGILANDIILTDDKLSFSIDERH
jgi:hypothetical protein